jgi:putative aminopeptidase FrvX
MGCQLHTVKKKKKLLCTARIHWTLAFRETKEEVDKMGVQGLCCYHPDEFMILNENKFVCRAIDNRMGGIYDC